MGVLDRFERGIEKAVNGAFARAFKSEVQPVEIASALRRAMDDRAAVVGRGRTLVPNAFIVELGSTDYARLTEYADVLAEELVANVQEHADAQQYAFPGPVSVGFEERDGLDTGVYQVRSATVRGSSGAQPGAQAAQAAQAAEASPPPEYAGPGAAIPPPPPVRTQAPPVPVPASAVPQPQTFPQAPPPAQAGHIPAARRPWLDVDGHAYPLLGALTIVGRGSDVDIVIDDPGVSRRHAEIRVTTDGPRLVAHVRDLGSTNGTFIDGNRVTGAVLTDGNGITMGRTRLVFRSGER
ncbi:MAG: FhaA domain-containing protein [Actinomycetales bacterium]